MGQRRDKFQSRYRKIRNRAVRRELVQRMGGKCTDCGKSYHPVCYDFHHKDPKTKEFVISGNSLEVSRERLLAEVDKCELLCSNCHRLRHYNEEKDDDNNNS